MTEILCKTDSFARSVRATVIECVATAPDRFHVVLDRTVVYPGGGGQPADCGTVSGYPILDVRMRPDGGVEHVLQAPVAGVVDVEVNWAARLDFMQQHTAQHLMTAIATARFGWKTIAFHMNQDRSDIEFELDSVSRQDLMTLEEAVNQAVFDDLPVSISFVSREQMSSMNVRSRLLPDGLEGPFRLVGIEGIDLNTCGGTHVQSTGQIQVVKILGTEKLARGVRVFYAAGSRVRRIFEQTIERESAIGAALTTGPSDFIASIEALKKSGRDLDTSLRQLSARLAGLVVERMLEDAGSGQVAVYHQDEADGDFLRQVAERFHEARPEALALLTGGASEGLFMVVGSDESVRRVGPAVAGILQGRGGGRGAIFQGRARALSLWSEAVAIIASESARST